MMTIDSVLPRSRSRSVLAAAAILLGAAVPASADVFNGVSLRIANEAAPPGGSIQLKVLVTEPKPIIIAMPIISYGAALGPVQGVLLPGAPDAAGAAVVNGHGLVIQIVSPSGTFGLSQQVPAVAVTIAVPATTQRDATANLTLDPLASSWVDPLGQLYPQQVKQGSFQARGTVSITDVVPGGGFLPAGSALSVLGMGFQPGAVVEVDGVAIASTTFVDATRLDVVTAADAQLDGRRVTVKNRDSTRAAYFSYLRAAEPMGASARPLVAATEAIYPVQTFSAAFLPTPQLAAGAFFGLALQNPGAADSAVAIELWSAGAVMASTAFTLPPRSEIAREASELFSGVAPPPGSFLRVAASAPLQVLGLLGDETAGSVTPVLPAIAFP